MSTGTSFNAKLLSKVTIGKTLESDCIGAGQTNKNEDCEKNSTFSQETGERTDKRLIDNESVRLV